MRWFLYSSDISRETTGITFVLAGSLLCVWNMIGIVVTATGVNRIESRLEVVSELLLSLFTFGAPLIVVGYITLSRWRYSHWIAVVVSICAVFGCILFATEVLGNVELQGNRYQRLPLSTLLFCFAFFLLGLSAANLYSHRWRSIASD